MSVATRVQCSVRLHLRLPALGAESGGSKLSALLRQLDAHKEFGDERIDDGGRGVSVPHVRTG